MLEKLHPALHALSRRLEKTPLVVAPTTQQLQETLLEVLEPGGSKGATFILVDALDEVPFHSRSGERAGIVRLLGTLASSQAPYLHILMTSRPHEDLLRSFGGLRSFWIANPIPAANIAADIELYVRSGITEIAGRVKINVNDQKRLIARLAGPEQTM
jgi:hypothetical protein